MRRAAFVGALAAVFALAAAETGGPDKRGQGCAEEAGMPLHFGACRGNGEVVRMLLAKGADKDARDASGFTPLHYAASQGQDESSRFLLEARADPTLTDYIGFSPLHWAAFRGHHTPVHYCHRFTKCRLAYF